MEPVTPFCLVRRPGRPVWFPERIAHEDPGVALSVCQVLGPKNSAAESSGTLQDHRVPISRPADFFSSLIVATVNTGRRGL
jgi:hypothetical protein